MDLREKRVLFSMGFLVVLVSFAVFSFFGGAHVLAAQKVVKVGWIGDLTGPTAHASKVALFGAQDWIRHANESGKIPGVKIELIPEDNKYNPSKTVLAYKKLKNEGVVGFIAVYSQDSELLKPICKRDKMVVIAAIGSDKVLDPPGWVFILYPTWVAHVNVLAERIQDTWDYKKMGRNPRLATIGWDNTMGTCHIKTSQKYVKDHNLKVDLGPFEVTPMRTMDFSANIMRIKEAGADYVYIPMVPGPTAVAIKQIKGASMPIKICVNDAGGAITVMKKVVGLENMQGIIRLGMYEWYSSNSPGMTLVKKLQAKYHPGKFIAMSSYFWCYQSSMVMTEAIDMAIKKKGFDKLNPVELYEQFQQVEIDTQGLNGSVLKLGKKRRVASSVIRFDEFEGKTWVNKSKWYSTD